MEEPRNEEEYYGYDGENYDYQTEELCMNEEDERNYRYPRDRYPWEGTYYERYGDEEEYENYDGYSRFD